MTARAHNCYAEAYSLIEAASREDTPLSQLWDIAIGKNHGAKVILVSRGDLPFEMYECLAAEAGLRWALNENRKLKTDLLHQLSASKSYLVRATVASHPDLSSDDIQRLASDTSLKVKENLASNHKITLETARRLLRTPNCHWQLVQNPTHFIEVDSELAASSFQMVRTILAMRTEDANILARLALDNKSTVRAQVAVSPFAGTELLVAMIRPERTARVLCGLFGNPHLPVESVRHLYPTKKLSHQVMDVVRARLQYGLNL